MGTHTAPQICACSDSVPCTRIELLLVLSVASQIYARPRLVMVIGFRTRTLLHHMAHSPFHGSVLTSHPAPHHIHINGAYVPLLAMSVTAAVDYYTIVADKVSLRSGHVCGLVSFWKRYMRLRSLRRTVMDPINRLDHW